MVISNTWSNPVWSRFCPRLLMTLLRGSNQGGKRCSFQSYSASHITWTAEARFIARPLSALVQTIYGSVGHVNFLHLGAFRLFYRMNELQNELYESKRDLRSRMNNLSGWKRTWKNSGLTGNQANCRASSLYVRNIPDGNELTMTCSPVGLISSMDRALRPAIAKVIVRFPIKPEFFQVLFQPLRLFILPQGSCSLSFLYPQLKNWSISYISIQNQLY